MVNSGTKRLVLLYCETRLNWLSIPVSVEEKVRGVSGLLEFGTVRKRGASELSLFFPSGVKKDPSSSSNVSSLPPFWKSTSRSPLLDYAVQSSLCKGHKMFVWHWSELAECIQEWMSFDKPILRIISSPILDQNSSCEVTRRRSRKIRKVIRKQL